jgi:hypothetical protein
VDSGAPSASALARAGEVTTTYDVASVLTADALPTVWVVDVGIVAGLPGTFPSLPVRETRARRTSALRRFLVFGLTLGTNRGSTLLRQVVMADLVRPISFQLCIDRSTKKIVAPTRVISWKAIIALDVVPEGRVRTNLVVERAKKHIIVRSLRHLQETLIPIVNKSDKVVVTHGQSLKHAMPIHERIDGANLVVFTNHPEKLPSLHQDMRIRQLSLLQMHFQRQRSFQLLSQEQGTIL